MNTLPPMSAVQKALPMVAVGLQKYCWIQAEVMQRDVSTDAEFQRRFSGFYRIRRNASWRRDFYAILEDRKYTKVEFSAVLDGLHSSTGRLEASFASKLVATIDPERPVIDSIVLKNLGLRLPPYSARDRVPGILKVYEQLEEWYGTRLSEPATARVLSAFKAFYPDASVSDVKALDLVLWQIRGMT